MELKLEGHFSHIDKFNKLKFTYLEDTREDFKDLNLLKLEKHCPGSAKPFTETDFTVTLPKMYKTPPTDIRGMVGLDCILRVKLKPYKFRQNEKVNK